MRFVFDNTSFELEGRRFIVPNGIARFGEKVVVGCANRWGYDSFVNWGLSPSPSFPILVYFKETQTRRTSNGEGAGSDGQAHFFPAGAWHSINIVLVFRVSTFTPTFSSVVGNV